MGNVYKQKGSIVLYKEERNGTDYIRIEYANSPTVALLLAYDEGIETTGSGWAYMKAASFKPVDFHKRYSPYAFIDYNKVYSLHFLQQQNFTPPIEPEKTIEIPDFPRNLITEGLMEITLSAQGHLSRPSRHKILRSLRSLRMVGRIGILCAFKVLPTWRKWSGNSYEIIELLRKAEYYLWGKTNEKDVIYNPQIQISAESETKRSIFREKDKTKRSKKESAQHSKSRNKSFVMTSVSAL